MTRRLLCAGAEPDQCLLESWGTAIHRGFFLFEMEAGHPRVGLGSTRF